MVSTPFLYSAFGLLWESAIECPELSPAEGRPQVRIVRGKAPARPASVRPAATIAVAGNRAWLDIPGVARYVITGGNEILVDAEAGVEPNTLRLFLLGSPVGALLHQRGILPLHASAVAVGEAAVAFTGASGAGKSTIAAGLARRGHSLIADDICAISRGPAGESRVVAGPPHMKLWADAVDHLFGPEASRDLSRVRNEMAKFRVPASAPEGAPRSLRRIYVMKTWNEPGIRIERLSGARRLEALIVNTYRLRLLEDDRRSGHFMACAHAAEAASVFTLSRPHTAPYDEVVDAVLRDLGAAA
jgi:hypothetical protein